MRKIIIYTVFLGLISGIFYSCQNQESIDLQNYVSSGKDIYQTKCQNCHGEKGEGLGLLAPPLTDTVFLKKHKPEIACYIKYGLDKAITINGKMYQEKMPAFAELTDIEIAQVMAYITNSFGNKQGFYDYDKVSADLKKCK